MGFLKEFRNELFKMIGDSRVGRVMFIAFFLAMYWCAIDLFVHDELKDNLWHNLIVLALAILIERLLPWGKPKIIEHQPVAQSNVYSTLDGCSQCEGIGYVLERSTKIPCMDCQNGKVPIEANIDKLIDFLERQISKGDEILKSRDKEIDDEMKRWAYGKKESYEFLLSLLLTNKFK